ncbi:MAG: LacI family transcriptional regulator, gluconate utilization system Gnt-I transcriptional repressor [Acetobacteraceae bacterium]|jgi:LacI family gluconate utilization system Gnt-I transcriptional repressor|nr:LacI family transcriptional regulator, gluconate utilization system Gnt-I transcriptional repressor [Acetobacteraceae bacterium]
MATKPRRLRASGAQGKNPTLLDVARHAGVGWITASRALREPNKVSAALRARVQTAVDELGYIANQVASGLASGSSRVVPVLIPTLAHSVFVPFLEGVHAELDKHGYEVLLGTTEYDAATEARLIATLLGWFPAGLLIAGVDHSAPARRRLEQAVKLGLPVIEFMDLTDEPLDLNVGLSHPAVGAAVADYLAGKGYRHIAYAGTMATLDHRSTRRLQGFRAALAARGLAHHYELRSEESFSFGLGGRLLGRLLEAHPQIEAIFFANDDLAAGALFEAQRRGIVVPRALALIGFNDLEISSAAVPSISSVNIDQLGMGRTVAQLLIERINNKTCERTRIDTAFRIIERDSTRMG